MLVTFLQSLFSKTAPFLSEKQSLGEKRLPLKDNNPTNSTILLRESSQPEDVHQSILRERGRTEEDPLLREF